MNFISRKFWIEDLLLKNLQEPRGRGDSLRRVLRGGRLHAHSRVRLPLLDLLSHPDALRPARVDTRELAHAPGSIESRFSCSLFGRKRRGKLPSP